MSCSCGHDRYDHRPSCLVLGGTLRAPVKCVCERFDDSRLPQAGERLEFGVHRLRSVDAEAEAWPIGESSIAGRLRRAAGVPVGMPKR